MKKQHHEERNAESEVLELKAEIVESEKEHKLRVSYLREINNLRRSARLKNTKRSTCKRK